DLATLARVRKAAGAPLINWFADDHWRFDDFTVHMAAGFDVAVTTDEDSLPRYEAAGHRNAFLSQWACNKDAYQKVSDAIEHEVTFVGQPHGGRRATVARLAEAGLGVECWGHGWPNGRL